MGGRTDTDRILRTLAAVPTGDRILMIGHVDPVLESHVQLLGFDVDTVPFRPGQSLTADLPDGEYSWVIATCSVERFEDVIEILAAVRSCVRPGGWVIVCTDDVIESVAQSLSDGDFDSAGYGIALKPTVADGTWFAIVRRVDPDTPA